MKYTKQRQLGADVGCISYCWNGSKMRILQLLQPIDCFMFALYQDNILILKNSHVSSMLPCWQKAAYVALLTLTCQYKHDRLSLTGF